MTHFLADLVSYAFDVPTWAPRAARRVAALVIVGTVLLAPDAFRAGMDAWVKHQTGVFMKRIAPLLEPDVSAPTSRAEISVAGP